MHVSQLLSLCVLVVVIKRAGLFKVVSTSKSLLYPIVLHLLLLDFIIFVFAVEVERGAILQVLALYFGENRLFLEKALSRPVDPLTMSEGF